MNEYQPRPVTAYGIETISGWPVKIYGLAVAGPSDGRAGDRCPG